MYRKSGTSLYPATKEDFQIQEKLSPGLYTLNKNLAGFFLTRNNEEFVIPSKLYGDTAKNSSRILRAFGNSNQALGVLLVGTKGSGKTLLAKVIASQSELPVILVNNPFTGDDFMRAISLIEDAVILFDEFEKVYEVHEQEQILTLFDGVYSSRKLILATSNQKHKISQYLLNRPSRFRYFIEFNGIENSFIEEYCKDSLLEKRFSDIPILKAFAGMVEDFNFDMLQGIVRELNHFPELSFNDTVKILNIRPVGYNLSKYILRCEDPNLIVSYVIDSNPLDRINRHGYIAFDVRIKNCEDDNDCEDDEVPSRLLYREELDMNNFVKISDDNTEYVFESEKGVKFFFVKEEPKVMRAYSSIF